MRQYYSDELYHHGIIGMKWGIRRYQNKDGTLTAAGKRKYGTIENLERGNSTKKEKKSRKEAIPGRRVMSDKELQDRISRLELEKKYKDLAQEDVNPGKRAANEIISKAAMTVLTSAAAGGMAYLLNYTINKKGDPNHKVDYKELARFVAPNPNSKKK